MSFLKSFPDRYNPVDTESKWIQFWDKNSSYKPTGKGDPFSIVIPPPNVTGTLHIGHALNHTIQDILIRIERMKGKDCIWVPGMDHAGIATQVIVEKELAKEGKKRTDYSRSDFEKKVWEWKEKSGGQITRQQRLLGESVDWDQERFTMDEGLSHAVFTVFKKLFDEGLIYRGERIINWCPSTKTAISDIEVEFRETKGKLYHIKYPIVGKNRFIVVATTRPETMLGDTAVCVHPDDDRYQDLKGTMLELPLTGRQIPFLFDSFVDKEFGTGAVKITPAHDANDYDASLRLGIEPINVMNPDASMNENAGKYKGLNRFDARKQIIADLESLGLIEKIEEYTHSIGHNQRGGEIIEPRLSTQWFVKIKPLAEKAIDSVKSGKIEFIPKMWEKTYFEWMENIKDWCISRQLWWGHRIPAYYCDSCGNMEVSEVKPSGCSKCKSDALRQDEDVLDTWFSSGLWPFTVFGWPADNKALKKYYPTSILVTGFDIIFFWVARMIMLGEKFMDEVPFRKVYIHGLVRDKNGKKFSKSLGNTIDPLIMMEKYGTDSFRFFLAATLPEGKDMLFDESRLDGYRSFCNKIWNSTRFILMNLPETYQHKSPKATDLDSADHWILWKWNETLLKFEQAYSKYQFHEMASLIYEFLWGDFCDWYIELAKPRVYGKLGDEAKETVLTVLAEVLLKAMGLLHPFMPFITEEIHSIFSTKSLTGTKWPSAFKGIKDNKAGEINLLIEIISGIRTVRGENNVPPDKKIRAIVHTKSASVKKIITAEMQSLLVLAKAESVEVDEKYIGNKTDTVIQFSEGEIFLPVSGLIDVEKEKIRLSKERDALSEEQNKLETKLKNPQFIEKAKPEVIEKEKDKLRIVSEKIKSVLEGIQKLG